MGTLYKIKVRNDGSSFFKKEWYVYSSILVLRSRHQQEKHCVAFVDVEWAYDV